MSNPESGQQPLPAPEPCPFCDSRPRRQHDSTRVTCSTPTCPASGQWVIPEVWNRRAARSGPPADAQRRYDEVRATLNWDAVHRNLVGIVDQSRELVEFVTAADALRASSGVAPSPTTTLPTSERREELAKLMDDAGCHLAMTGNEQLAHDHYDIAALLRAIDAGAAPTPNSEQPDVR